MRVLLDERLTDVDAYRRQEATHKAVNRAIWRLLEDHPTMTTWEAKRIANQALELLQEAGHGL